MTDAKNLLEEYLENNTYPLYPVECKFCHGETTGTLKFLYKEGWRVVESTLHEDEVLACQCCIKNKRIK